MRGDECLYYLREDPGLRGPHALFLFPGAKGWGWGVGDPGRDCNRRRRQAGGWHTLDCGVGLIIIGDTLQ